VKSPTLMLASVVVAGLAVAARADQAIAVGQVPFEFTVGSTKLPAGHYEILKTSNDEQVLMVRNVDTKKTALVEYVTRLATRDKGTGALVFDESAGERVLSEIHLTNSDGYLLPGLGKKPHTHTQVKTN
jgi:hypothetical protein